ncbi:hypothetical protein BVRB_1g006210 [Beta vulgaris subsp. vulgaris]|uniref:receptor-like protein EIX2 n=1 Tax=Beta vulgaris subsp. vulgaris TaxID=3555 RepID=UPI00065C61C6|nr:receptor-like protein EIX2 [Beta vulgaris subsp. vulgaris]KMT20644.1 hypothetical protein BVRB_1g006210 [Beta vulgaris subsp. vulgaris]
MGRFLLVTLYLNLIIKLCLSEQNGSTTYKCIESEREALSTFRMNLVDHSQRLSSWDSDDCCSWKGITCDDQTGHVTKINLQNKLRSRDAVFDSISDTKTSLSGKVSSSLLELKYLSYLDLSLNNFGGPIPKFFGDFQDMSYLNLACASFSGEIPPQLGNLTNLHYLDLYSYSSSQDSLTAKSLHWLTKLTSLKYLNLGSVLLYHVSSDALQSINMLHSLRELNLYNCDMENHFLDLDPMTLVNFTSLVTLNMSENFIEGPFPHWLSNLTSLEVLDLSLNDLNGPLPIFSASNSYNLQYMDLSLNDLDVKLTEVLLGLKSLKANLEYLDLLDTKISGSIPTFIGHFSSLKMLDLSGNAISGTIPTSLGNLSSLRKLDLSGNSFWGSIPYSIGNLSSLEKFDLSGNEMNGSIPESLGLLSELVELHLDSNKWQGPAFPVWLQSQSSLTSVVLQNTGISDIIPVDWLSDVASQLTYLDLSKNSIRGKLPARLVFANLSIIDLSSNRIEGDFPNWLINARELHLQDNLFSGTLPEDIGDLMPSLLEMDLSWNLFSGAIPSSFCGMKSLGVLSLRNNNFSKEIPDCWERAEKLQDLDLSNNRLSGTMPPSLFTGAFLSALLLSNNNLDGEIPKSLFQIHSGLMMLDIGGNNFSGSLPIWLGESLSSLLILVLRENSFSGKIPTELCKLEYLHFLDLSWNTFSGTIPKCFNNLTALVNGSYDIFHDTQRYFGIHYDGHLVVTTKGSQYEYGKTAALVNGIDLSGNNLSGSIPPQITSLSLLAILNLSMNHLSGNIPQNIGDMRSLETLDLSNNHLSGAIPSTLSLPTFLAHLNLSFNNLEGRVPSGSELQTLNDPSIYEGNSLLCGAPLLTKCAGDHGTTSLVTPTSSIQVQEDEDDKNDYEGIWFYITIVLGFIVGFWSVCGTLALKKSWRDAYFYFLEDMGNKIGLRLKFRHTDH